MNVFENPQYYRNLLLNAKLLQFPKKALRGKSLACLFLTRFCNVGCSFCFFNSPPMWKNNNIDDQFSDEGVDKFLQFSKEANLGYILVSGGGEPLYRKAHILKIIEEAVADKIVLVTSGGWAKNYDVARAYVNDMYNASLNRKQKAEIVLRVSVSDYHAVKLGIKSAQNIIKIFDEDYRNISDFGIQLKSFDNDSAIRTLIDTLEASVNWSDCQNFVSDNKILVKSIPKKCKCTLKSGYSFNIGISRIFDASLKPNLHIKNSFARGVSVVEEDLKMCEGYNSAVVYNEDGTEGIDWSINYNGNISVWQNQVRDNYANLYHNQYQEILESYLNDPIIYSVIDKGNLYRETIINEVNPRSILRSKAMGLRDCVGAVIFEEEKNRLYYSTRVLQDYIREDKIEPNTIQYQGNPVKELLALSTLDLINLYKSANYDIVEQQKNKTFVMQEWYDLLELIKLGNYEISRERVERAIEYYNQKVENKINNLEEITEQCGDIVRRLTHRLMYRSNGIDHNQRVSESIIGSN